jgi:DNA-binding response OmpR family regulator
MTQRILFANDRPLDEALLRALKERGFEVTCEDDRERAYAELTNTAVDLLIIDLADVAGAVELLKRVRATPELSRTLLLTIAEWGTGQPTLALSQGTDAFEAKPIDADRLIAAVEKLLRPRMVMTAKASTTRGEAGADE